MTMFYFHHTECNVLWYSLHLHSREQNNVCNSIHQSSPSTCYFIAGTGMTRAGSVSWLTGRTTRVITRIAHSTNMRQLNYKAVKTRGRSQDMSQDEEEYTSNQLSSLVPSVAEQWTTTLVVLPPHAFVMGYCYNCNKLPVLATWANKSHIIFIMN